MSGLAGQWNGLSFNTNRALKQMDKDNAPSPPPVEPNYKTGIDRPKDATIRTAQGDFITPEQDRKLKEILKARTSAPVR